MIPYAHGGDVLSFHERYGFMPLDFSVNTNPLGPPSGVARALHRATASLGSYPDPACRALTRALSDHLAIPGEQIIWGNGAADLIYRLAFTLRPRRALMPVPTFGEYAQALNAAHCNISTVPLSASADFALPRDFASHIVPGVDMVFLCNPNNPTGQLIRRDALMSIAERAAEVHALLVIDECFLCFVDDPDAYTMRGALHEFPNLFILDAFTKRYAMAGLRLGYGLSSDRALLTRLRDAAQPWPISSVAQAAGVAALTEHFAYMASTSRLIGAERRYLYDALSQLGLHPCPSCANFILLNAGDPALGEQLARRGILIRDARNFTGLNAGYFRVAVRTHDENERLIAAIKAVRHG